MKDKTRETIARGDKAKGLLQNELLNQWWDDVNTTLDMHMRRTPTSDVQRVMELKSLMDAVGKMKKDFQRYVTAGENAKTKLGRENMRQKARRLVS